MFVLPSPLQKIETHWANSHQVELWIKREDLIHPLISGNKYRKLKYNLIEAKKQGKDTILSFGGAFSNHIHALAAACNFHGFKSIGVIRGEQEASVNPTLTDAQHWGMQLHFIDRTSYRQKTETEFIKLLRQKFGDFYLIPEGGTNALALQGTAEILPEINQPFDYITCAVGTGGTISGLIQSNVNHSEIVGFAALKGNFLEKEVQGLLKGSFTNWSINSGHHCGGYAKTTPELWQFIQEFKEETNISLDPIYTGKMMLGLKKMVENKEIKPKSKILAIHTGGLQGLRGFE